MESKNKNLLLKRIYVTPEVAKRYLETNIEKNRKINKNTLRRYCKDIVDGNWCESTGETIKITENGVLVDGQHRLMAIIETGIPHYFDFVFGVSDYAFKYIDTGKPRGAHDIFRIEEIPNSGVIPGIIRFYNGLKTEKIQIAGKNIYSLSNSQILDVYYKNPEMWQKIAKKSQSLYKEFGRILPQAAVGGFLSFFSDIDENSANDFMNKLCSGKTDGYDQINLLRNRLIKDRTSFIRMSQLIKNAMIIKTWNNYRKNKTQAFLRFQKGMEKMPKAI